MRRARNHKYVLYPATHVHQGAFSMKLTCFLLVCMKSSGCYSSLPLFTDTARQVHWRLPVGANISVNVYMCVTGNMSLPYTPNACWDGFQPPRNT